MKQLDRNSDFVRIRLDIPKDTYRNLMGIYKYVEANGITSSPDGVAVSCIDIIYRLLLKKNIQIYYTGESKSPTYKDLTPQEFERGEIDGKERQTEK